MQSQGSQADPQAPYYSISGEGFTLHVNARVLATLDALVRQALESPSRGGFEIGGLLLGSDAPGSWLEAVHPVAMDHRLSPSHERLVEEAVSQLQQSGVRVIGSFRIHTSGEFKITDQEDALADLIAEAESWILLIRAQPAGQSLARLYLSRRGKRAELPSFRLLPTAASAAVVRPVSARPDWRDPPWRWSRSRVLSLAALLLCAAFAAYLVPHKRSPSPPPAPSTTTEDLDLAVRRTGDALFVSWNHSSQAVKDATSGLLTIKDGGIERDLQLIPSELASDTVVYVPQSATVELRLQVYRAQNRFAAESVIFATGLPLPASGPAARKAISEPLIVEPSRSRFDEPMRSPAPQVRPPTQPGETPRPAKFQPPPVARQPMHLPEVSPQISTAPAIAEAPQLALPRRADPPPILPPQRSNVAPLPPPRISYVGPVSIRRISPAVPAGLRSLIQDKVSVEVKATIDAEGKVTGATPLNASSASQKLLSPTAVQAAMLWRFEPARRNGQPVSSETVLKFDFERPSQ